MDFIGLVFCWKRPVFNVLALHLLCEKIIKYNSFINCDHSQTRFSIVCLLYIFYYLPIYSSFSILNTLGSYKILSFCHASPSTVPILIISESNVSILTSVKYSVWQHKV